MSGEAKRLVARGKAISNSVDIRELPAVSQAFAHPKTAAHGERCVALLNYLGAYAFVPSFEAEVTKKDRSDRYDGPT